MTHASFETIEPIEILLFGIVGAIVGSFLATLALRWGQGLSVVGGRSRCDGCGRTLAPRSMIPVVSYIALRGRCSTCEAPINARHLLMEVSCSLIGIVAVMAEPGVDGYIGAVLGWQLAVLALLDADHLWLPDALVLPLAVAGLAVGTLGVGPDGIDRILGVAVGVGIIGGVKLAYRLRTGRTGIGSGDVKLGGALGAWIGGNSLPWTIVLACVLGLMWASATRFVTEDGGGPRRLPFGTFLCLGAWLTWLAVSLL